MRIKLPVPIFELREWSEHDFIPVSQAVKGLSSLADKAGRTSDRFQIVCDKLRRLARSGREEEISDAISSSLYVRAVTFLLNTEKDFFFRVPLSADFLAALRRPRQRLGRLSLLQLIGTFFIYFDEIAQDGDFKTVCEFISKELGHLDGSQGTDLGRIAGHRQFIFSPDGPSRVVKFARDKSADLDCIFQELGIGGFSQGRFQQVCRYHYYLETLRYISVGDYHSVLDEVCKAEVFNASAGDGRLIGHEVLSVLIDRSGAEISDPWRKVVLTIAGDPRIPSGHRRYQKWWALLGDERIRKMRGWLSRLDLLLFLDILEEYGRSSGDLELQRMFPARKTFLEGLFKQNLIQQSRLFVGARAEQYLTKRYRREDLPEFARVKDTYRSIIYLQVENCHLIEGSHSFKLWFFPRLPSSSKVSDYAVDMFSPSSLGMDLDKAFKKEFGPYGEQPAGIRHYPPLGWQYEAIQQLKMRGIRLDIEALFSRSDYREYLWRYGL